MELQTRLAFIDTSAFEKKNYQFGQYALGRLQELIEDEKIHLLITDVTRKEIDSHLKRKSEEAASMISKMQRDGMFLRNTPNLDCHGIFTKVKGEDIYTVVSKKFDDFVESGYVETINVSIVNPQLVFDAYFNNRPPFGKESKKHEFPDAFALLSLEGWAESSGKKLLVVSKDGDWTRFCKDSELLVAVDDLGTALSLFHRDASVACNALSLRLQNGGFPNLVEAIEDAIYRHIDRMDFIVDAEAAYSFEDEIGDYEILDVVIGDGGMAEIEPIDAGDDYLVAKIPVSVGMRVECDFSFSIKDGIDKDYVPIGSASVSTEKTLSFDVLVTLGTPVSEADSIDDIEVTGKGRLYLEFGYVEPNWHEDPDSDYY